MTEKRETRTTHNDPVLALYNTYFRQAQLMHGFVHFLRDTVFGGQTKFGEFDYAEHGISDEFLVYYRFWLSSLFVVAEGILELGCTDQNLTDIIQENYDSLRLFRNGTFHFQKSPLKHVQFHDGTANRMNWAEELHEEFIRYFASYVDIDSPDIEPRIPLSLMLAVEFSKGARGRKKKNAGSE